MKTPEKTPTEQAISREPFPASRKIYVAGEVHDISVAMREIQVSDTKINDKAVKNDAVIVYDTSGPYTDTDIAIDVKKGLNKVRESWILKRGDVEQLHEISSHYGRERLQNKALDQLRFEHAKNPLRAKKKSKRNTTPLRAKRHHNT